MTYFIPILNKELVQLLIKADLSEAEAKAIQINSRNSKKTSIVCILASLLVMAVSMAGILLFTNALFLKYSWVVLAMLGAFFLGIFIIIFALNNIYIKSQYLKAVQAGYPFLK